MPCYLDVDNYLNISDYRLCIHQLKWPWEETHFIKLNVCVMCHLPADPSLPRHFFCRTDTKITFRMLCDAKNFWCGYCMFAIYEHYPGDECQFCAV